jgi:hypothetical protein
LQEHLNGAATNTKVPTISAAVACRDCIQFQKGLSPCVELSTLCSITPSQLSVSKFTWISSIKDLKDRLSIHGIFDSSFLRLLHPIYYFSLPSFIPSLLTFFTSCSYLPPVLQLHSNLFYTILYHHYTLLLLCSPSPFLPSFLPYLPHSLTFLTYNLPSTITCSPHWHTLFHTCPGRAWSLITT